MDFFKVFDTIVDIMHHDYSGFKDKRGWDDPKRIRRKMKALDNERKLNRLSFEPLVEDYLLDFKDEHNALRSSQEGAPQTSVGFRVRHCGPHLYVERVTQERQLHIGDIITAIDGESIESVAVAERRWLKSDIPERERWESVLLKAKTILVKKENGEELILPLQRYEDKSEAAHYTFESMNGIAVFRFNDFTDLDQMKHLFSSHKNEIQNLEQWVIDVRECRGGSDDVYFPLMNAVFPPNPIIVEDGLEHLMTERNYRNRLASFQKFDQIGQHPLTDALITQMKAHRNAGFVTFNLSDYEEDYKMTGSESPRQIVVLTDKFCASSGEQFVLEARQSPKVTVMGRTTRGVLDYSNCAIEHFEKEGYDFYYATSRSKRVDYGTGVDFHGIEPDQYIPWTPEHLHHDVDLEAAIRHLKKA